MRKSGSWIAFASALAIAWNSQPSRASFTTLAGGFSQTDIVTGIPIGASLQAGPIETAVLGNGDLLVSTFEAGLLRFPSTGGAYTAASVLNANSSVHAFTRGLDGVLYATSTFKPVPGVLIPVLVSINEATGAETVLFQNPPFSASLDGITVDPLTGDLYIVVRGGTMQRYVPSTGAVSVFSSNVPNMDGLTCDCDGSRFYGADVPNGTVVSITRAGVVSTLASAPGGDGIALGRPGTVLDGSLFVNKNDGTIDRIDLASGALSNFASGGTRGDMIGTDDEGNLYASQLDTVVKITPTGGSFSRPGAGLCSNLRCSVRSLCTSCMSAQGGSQSCTGMINRVNDICSLIASGQVQQAKAHLNALINQAQGLSNGCTDGPSAVIMAAQTLLNTL